MLGKVLSLSHRCLPKPSQTPWIAQTSKQNLHRVYSSHTLIFELFPNNPYQEHCPFCYWCVLGWHFCCDIWGSFKIIFLNRHKQLQTGYVQYVKAGFAHQHPCLTVVLLYLHLLLLHFLLFGTFSHLGETCLESLAILCFYCRNNWVLRKEETDYFSS